ncbi:MAG TPA: sigma-70 family RNA polymerase sigma factor [Myxococcales bacterium]|nr:sigma-70 family RNA polymerase sigma factor [Myxococcales bacterium]
MPPSAVHWLAALYAQTAALGLAVAQRIVRDRQEAEDILQDAYVSALQQRGNYDPRRGSELGWILAIIRAKALDRLRSRRVRLRVQPQLQLAEIAPENEADPLAAAYLTQGFGALPAHQRAALVLAYFEGLTHVEIAAQMGAPLGSVKTWLRAGIAQLAIGLRDPAPDSVRHP